MIKPKPEVLRLLFFWGFAFSLLTACTAEPTVPTRAAAAMLHTGIVNINGVPATFTPQGPTATIDPSLNFNAASSLGPTRIPTITPIIPTYTATPTPTPTPTHTPTPSATPDPDKETAATHYPAHFFDYQGSKMSLHVIRNNNPDIMEFVRQARPPVIKLVDDLGFSSEIKEASPGTLIVGRLHVIGQQYTGVPEEEARKFVQNFLPKYRANPAVDYWEGWNEPDPGLLNIDWYTRFEQERVREMATYGLRTAVGGFATGVPEVNEFALFVPAIETAIQHGGILTLHEYGAPLMTQGYGSALPGYPFYEDRGSLTLRYRWYYREILEPAGLVIPLIITEAGIDGILGNRPGPPGYGWADFQGYAVDEGWGSNGTEAFINQVAWYDSEVRQDYYVLGFTLFSAGAIGHWKNYDINSILPHLTEYARGQN